MIKGKRLSAPFQLLLLIFFVLPVSTNYEMHDYGFGSGGMAVGSSSNYSMSGITGEMSGAKAAGSNYDLGAGLQFVRQTNTPAAPTFTNVANNYNKLKFVLNTGSNPSDTVFAVAISTDNFVTTNYIQADHTIGTNPVYQTYTTWGGASGAYVIGLSSSTTYKIKVTAVQTKYTESGFSSAASASTVSPSLSYDIDVSPTDTETAAPYTVDFGTLNVGSVTTASNKIWVDLDTNAEQGAFVYVYSNTTGLTSAGAGYTLTSASGDLNSVSEGFGIQVSNVTQTSGGPLVAVSPYDQSSNVVGILNTSTRNILTSSAAPITAGRAAILLKAKAATTTPTASDYSSVITLIASGTF